MFLKHYGVKGMKWGVRRYQNPDGTLTNLGRKRYREALGRKGPRKIEQIDDETRSADSYNKSGIIPKGVKAYRVASSNDVLDNKRKYVSLTTEGRNAYQEQYIDGMLGKTAKPYDIANIEYETIKDLRLAPSKEVDSFIASLRPDTIKYNTILKDVESLERADNGNQSRQATEAREYMNKGRQYLYKARNQALFSTKYDEDNPVFKHFADLGYDAISDVEDGGLGNGNYLAPVIILDPSSSLKETIRY